MENNETRDSGFASQSVSHTNWTPQPSSGSKTHCIYISGNNSLHQLWLSTTLKLIYSLLIISFFLTCSEMLSGPKNKETESMRPASASLF